MIVKKDKPTNGRKEIIAKSSMITALCASNVLLNTPIIILKDTHTKNTTILINEESKIEDESKNPNYQLYNIEENDDMLTELKDTHSSDAIIEMEYDSTKPETILAIKNQLLQDNTLRTTLNDILNQFVNQATPIAPIEYIPEINESSSTTVLEEQEYIRKYCDIFGLNNEKVYQILYNITDGFQNEKYVKEYIIGDSKLKKRNVTCKSKEMAILIAVRNIYYDAAPYGYTDNDLKTGIEFITDQDYSHQIADISNVLEIDPALVYAIIRAESSFNSPMFLNKHNPGGLKFDGVFAAFPSTTAGFAEEALEILKYRIDGKVTIEQIGATYVGSKDPNKSKWFDNVNNIYHEAIANYDTLFGSAPTQTPPSNSNEPDFIEPTPPKVESTIEKITSKIETTITNAIDTYNKRIEQLKEEKQYIKKYSDIYGLDYEKIYQILSDLTNHFQDKNYQNNFIIGQSKLGNQKITCKSKEMAILIATYNIYYDPEQYGYSLDELKTDTKYISELDNVEQITSISNILDIDPALTYAICKTQCNFDSDIFLKNNNPGKLRMNGTYATFPSTTAGFIEQAIEILKLEINDQTTTIEQIIAKYSIISNNANQFWITTVNTNYKDAITNPTILSKLPYTEPETIIDQKESILEGNNIKTNLTNMMETFIQMKTILSEAAKNPEEKKYIKKYCDIYGLDTEKVYQILSDITDSFQNKAYQENYIIGDSKLKGRNVVCKNKEMAILIAVRNIYHNEENYIKQYGNLKINIEYQNERDYPQQIAEISNVLGTNPALTYAICKARTNDFNNELFLINNNPGGLNFNKINYETFPTQTAGFVEATLEVLKYQIDGKTVITEIGIDYTHTPNDTWNQEITKNYTEAMQHYQDLFEQVKEKTYTLENK